jgi:hypothetical protein
MSHERDQASLQRHIREAEDRATAGGHELGPWQPASLSGLYAVEAVCLRCGEKAEAGYRALYVAFDRVCPGPENGRARPTPASQRKERHE